MLSVAVNAQEISNVTFQQVGKTIEVSYDLSGYESGTIELFYSTNDGKSFKGPLNAVTGAVGKNQKSGNKKKIIWDVLAEGIEITGNVKFKVRINKNEKVEYLFDDNVMYKTYNDLSVIKMVRSGKRVRSMYLTSFNRLSAYERYKVFKYNKNIIACYSGPNASESNIALNGLNIQNGILINPELATNNEGDFIMDGLVIVYPFGGMAVGKITDGNLKLSGGGEASRIYDLRKPADLTIFKRWAQSQNVTVFQTDLVAWNNKLFYSDVTNSVLKKRRFLAIGYTPNMDVVYYVIENNKVADINESSSKVMDFLMNEEKLKVVALLKMHPGFFNTFNENGKKTRSNGDISKANNLMIHYYE